MGRINFSISSITSLHLILFLRNSRHICTDCEKLILYENFLPLFDFGHLIFALFVASCEKLYITIREYISCWILSDFFGMIIIQTYRIFQISERCFYTPTHTVNLFDLRCRKFFLRQICHNNFSRIFHFETNASKPSGLIFALACTKAEGFDVSFLYSKYGSNSWGSDLFSMSRIDLKISCGMNLPLRVKSFPDEAKYFSRWLHHFPLVWYESISYQQKKQTIKSPWSRIPLRLQGLYNLCCYAFSIGGGEGNWTPVRKLIHATFYERILPIKIPLTDRR